ncbi:unnamed protein product [Gadus morhua 'NCC']
MVYARGYKQPGQQRLQQPGYRETSHPMAGLTLVLGIWRGYYRLQERRGLSSFMGPLACDITDVLTCRSDQSEGPSAG